MQNVIDRFDLEPETKYSNKFKFSWIGNRKYVRKTHIDADSALDQDTEDRRPVEYPKYDPITDPEEPEHKEHLTRAFEHARDCQSLDIPVIPAQGYGFETYIHNGFICLSNTLDNWSTHVFHGTYSVQRGLATQIIRDTIAKVGHMGKEPREVYEVIQQHLYRNTQYNIGAREKEALAVYATYVIMFLRSEFTDDRIYIDPTCFQLRSEHVPRTY